MKKFYCFNDFMNHLEKSIKGDKDVYVFTFCFEDDCDYVFDTDEERSNDYYISQFIDINILQRKLHNDFVDEYGMDLVIVLDWVTDEDNDMHYQRLHIFESV